MRSKVAKRLLAKTPPETKIFIDKYADIVVLVNQILKEKGYTQKQLAEKMGKKPSEISKWLNGEHNFTLRSLAKLEAELGEPIICIPKRKTFQQISGNSVSMTVYSYKRKHRKSEFVEGVSSKNHRSKMQVA